MEYEPSQPDMSDEPAEILVSSTISDDPVRDYLRNISKIPLLDAEQEVELSKRIEAGQYAARLLLEQPDTAIASEEELQWLVEDGIEAKKRFLEANTRLVVSIAKKYTRHTISMDQLDLIDEGNIGLNRAVEKFDYKQGYKFSTYASWWVRQAVTRAIAEQSRTIRIPVHLHESIVAMNSARRKLEKDGFSVTSEMIAEEMGVTVERVTDLQEWSKHAVSLDQPIDEEGETTVGSLFDPNEHSVEDTVAWYEMREKIHDILGLLGEREAKIIMLRFGFEDGVRMTYKQIGEAIGISHERVRQLLVEALRKLSQNTELEGYAETRSAS